MSGFPLRVGRAPYGPSLRDEKRVADPRTELGAETLNLWFCQLAGLGMLAPLAVICFDPRTPTPKLLWGGFSWNPGQTYTDVTGTFPYFAYEAIDLGGGQSDMRFTFDATVGDDPIAFSGGLASGAGANGATLPDLVLSGSVRMEAANIARVALYKSDTGAAVHVLLPVTVALF